PSSLSRSGLGAASIAGASRSGGGGRAAARCGRCRFLRLRGPSGTVPRSATVLRLAVGRPRQQVPGKLEARYALAERLRQRVGQALGAVENDHLIDRSEWLRGGLHDGRPLLRQLLTDDRVLVLRERVCAGLDGFGLGDSFGANRFTLRDALR